MKNLIIFIFCLFAFNANAKETTFDKTLFDKAQSEGKIVVVSSWVKYCTSCASQMKVLDKAKNDFNYQPLVSQEEGINHLIRSLKFPHQGD